MGSMAEEDETREEAVKVPVSAGPCSLLAWPLGNLTALITGVPNLPAYTQFRPPPAKPFGDLLDHLRTCLGSIRSFLVAYVIVFYIHGDDYPAFGAATTLSWSWMWPLLVRNILSAWAVCGFWDWLMYLSPLAARCQVVKLRERILNSPGSNRSKSTRNFQLGRKCATMPSGRQLVWSVPLFSRLPTLGELSMANFKLLPHLLKVPSLI